MTYFFYFVEKVGGLYFGSIDALYHKDLHNKEKEKVKNGKQDNIPQDLNKVINGVG
jgi:hypothetical protein